MKKIITNKNSYVSLFMVVFLLFSTISGASAQTRQTAQLVDITAKIVDAKSKTPIIGATIQLTAYGIYGVADKDGNVSLKRVPVGTTSVEVRMLGYVTYNGDINAQSGKNLVFELKEANLELENIQVLAKASAAGASTSSKIERQAIDHLQATSLQDLMQLLPGQSIFKVPDMMGPQQLSFRQNSSTYNNTFGAAVIVDGVPMSANAMVSDPTGLNTATGRGIDVREVSADNIESVEVIRGIASAEYGDLTTGAMIVNTRKGKTPLEVRTKINPSSLNTSIAKGFRFENGGTLNANFDYAQAWGDPRNKTQSFDRYTTGITYGLNITKKWSTTTKFSYNGMVDWRGLDPDEVADGTKTTQNNHFFRVSHIGRISVNKLFMRTLNYSAGYNYGINDSHQTKIIAAGGGLDQITAMNSGYFEVPRITQSYFAGGGTKSRPEGLFLKASNQFAFRNGPLLQLFNMGIDYRVDRNKGIGFYNDDLSKPFKLSNDARPRPYFDMPTMRTASAFFEDNFNLKIAKGVSTRVQAGLRFETLQLGLPEQVSSLSPRINASLTLGPWFTLRGGWGLSSKTPSMEQLYPQPKYSDRIAASYTPANPADWFVLYNTRVADVERNNNLKNMVSNKTELGFDISIPKTDMRISIIGFSEKMTTGFASDGLDQRIYMANYYTSGNGLIVTPGQRPIVDWQNPTRVDTVWTTTGRLRNSDATLNRGVEFDIDFGRIKSINTNIVFSGAYTESKAWDNEYLIRNPSPVPSPWAEGLPNTAPFKLLYPKGLNLNITRVFNSAITLVTNIPRMKMVASITGQMIWYKYSYERLAKGKPIYWINNDLSVRPITPEMWEDPDFRIKGVLMKDQILDPKDTEPSVSRPLWIAHARLTKEISKAMNFSFFARNFLYHTPFQSTSKSTTVSEMNTDTFAFGMELFLKF